MSKRSRDRGRKSLLIAILYVRKVGLTYLGVYLTISLIGYTHIFCCTDLLNSVLSVILIKF